MGKSFRLRVLAIVLVFTLVAAAGIFAVATADIVDYSSCTAFGSGTADDPYRIYSGAQIIDISHKLAAFGEGIFDGKYFEVQNDLSTNLTGTLTPYSFKGILDGKGHTFEYSGTVIQYLGEGGVIRNLNLKTSKAPTLDASYSFVYTVQENAIVENCTSDFTCVLDSNKLEKYNLMLRMRISAFCRYNYGTIRNFTVNFSVSQKLVGRKLKNHMQICVFLPVAIYDSGNTENCTVNYKDCILDVSDYSIQLYGFDNKNTRNCTVKGDIYAHSTQSESGYCFKLYYRPFSTDITAINCTNSLNLTVKYRDDLPDYLIYDPLPADSIDCVVNGSLTLLGKPKAD